MRSKAPSQPISRSRSSPGSPVPLGSLRYFSFAMQTPALHSPAMNIDQLRKLCLSFPGATEQIQWEDDLLFKVGGRMFVVIPLEPARVWLTLKADPEEFADLVERPGIIPAPYLARAKWISVESPDTLPQSEVAALLRRSYQLVAANLPKAVQQSLASKASGAGQRKPANSMSRRKSRSTRRARNSRKSK
jgi:predicted DNA-binding protein (MmcQ/YjbR family)